MLTITIPKREFFNSKTNEFITIKEKTLQLEHSLVSISKWESKWHKAFLGKQEKTTEELIDYIRCMTITQHVDPNVYLGLTEKNIDEINAYINDPMSATIVPETKGKGSGDTVTSELIYYWMVSFNLPVEFQKWHLNRLLTLIKVCSAKSGSSSKKKMTANEIRAHNRMLNEQRKAKLGTKG